MRYVVRLMLMTTLMMLALYGLDFVFAPADRFPDGLSLFAVSFMLATIPGPGDLRAMSARVLTRVFAPAIGIGLALWLVVGFTDLRGPSHSDSVLTVGGICLALSLVEKAWKWRRNRPRAGDTDRGNGPRT